MERQAKYIRDGITGCWLFERPIPKLTQERPDLPVFYVELIEGVQLLVHLGDRRKVDLHAFLKNFISNNIQFKELATTTPTQTVELNFYDFVCWNCKALNHLYFVGKPFFSSCNATIEPQEFLWESNKVEHRPEIVAAARQFIEQQKELNLHLGEIKERSSRMAGTSYMSFGCYQCDKIFGDWYVLDAQIDARDSPDLISHRQVVELTENVTLPIPHWCFPINGQFCSGH